MAIGQDREPFFSHLKSKRGTCPNRIKHYRVKAGLTQAQAAAESGVSGWGTYEQATKRHPRPETVEAMALTLGVQTHQLFTDGPEPVSDESEAVKAAYDAGYEQGRKDVPAGERYEVVSAAKEVQRRVDEMLPGIRKAGLEDGYRKGWLDGKAGIGDGRYPGTPPKE